MLYSAPPRETDGDEEPADAAAETDAEPADVTEATANWTGAVPADD